MWLDFLNLFLKISLFVDLETFVLAQVIFFKIVVLFYLKLLAIVLYAFMYFIVLTGRALVTSNFLIETIFEPYVYPVVWPIIWHLIVIIGLHFIMYWFIISLMRVF